MPASGPPSAPNNRGSNLPVVVLCNSQACFAPRKPSVPAAASCVVADCTQHSSSSLLLTLGLHLGAFVEMAAIVDMHRLGGGSPSPCLALTVSQLPHRLPLVPCNGFAAQGAAANCFCGERRWCRLGSLKHADALCTRRPQVLVAQKVTTGVYRGVSTSELDNLAAETAASMTATHPDYALVSAENLLSIFS